MDKEGTPTGAAREEVVRAMRTMTAKEKKRIAGLARGDVFSILLRLLYPRSTTAPDGEHPWLSHAWETENRCPSPVSNQIAKMVRNSKTYTWITVWSVACLPVILWDALYLFLRSVLSHPFGFLTLSLVTQPEVYGGWRSPLDLGSLRNLPGGRLCVSFYFSLGALSSDLPRKR